MNPPKPIEGFPNYLVFETGEVVNDDTGRALRPHVNQNGIVSVTLFENGRHHRKTLALLVARAFLQVSEDQLIFGSPINLDGDRLNNHVDNIAMRPRWFVTKYYAQFRNDIHFLPKPIVNVETGEIFHNLRDPAMKYGLLEMDILVDLTNQRGVFPTGIIFKYEDAI